MDKKKIGIILIAVGAFFLLNTLNLIGEDLFLYLLSAGFIFTYFMLGARKHYRNIGFLFPGAVLLAVALFSDIQQFDAAAELGGGLFFIFLGAAFLIVFIHTRAFSKWDWPIYPAVSLILFGIFITAVEKTDITAGAEFLNYLFPIILIAAGVYLLYRQKK